MMFILTSSTMQMLEKSIHVDMKTLLVLQEKEMQIQLIGADMDATLQSF